MKIYKKILLSLFIFITFLCIKNNVFATFDFTFEDTSYSLADLPFDISAYPDFVILYNYKDDYYQVGYPSASYQLPFYYQTTKNALGRGVQYWAEGDTTKTVIGPSSNGLNWYYYNSTDGSGLSWGTRNITSQNQMKTTNNFDCATVIYSSCDIINEDGSIFYAADEDEYIFPYIADTDEVLTNLDNIDDILIFPGSLLKSYLPISFKIDKYTDPLSDKELIFEISLDSSSPYYLYIVENPDDYWWEVPTELFKNLLENGSEYHFILSGIDEYGEAFSISRSITYGGTTYVPPSDEEIQTDAIKEQTQKIEEQTDAIKDQTEKIEEQTEVQKNIFQRIGEILSYINPLSENFFAYKLIDLLIDALKSLFVPKEGFFNNWIADINDYFSSRFGMVYSSIDFVVDFLTRLADISSNLNTDYTIHIPEFKLFDTTLIPEYSYNLADLLENETFKNIHTIYLCIIDVIMFLWLLIFARNSFAEIFGGRFIDDVFGAVESDSVSYRKYERHQENKTRYTKEQNLKRYKNK